MAFIAPSFLMVLALSALYVRFGGLSWMLGAFYGVGAAVIAVIARSSVKLAKLTLQRDPLLWGICLVSAAVTAWTQSEIFSVFVVAGVLTMAIRSWPRAASAAAAVSLRAWGDAGLQAATAAGSSAANDLGTIFWFFA